MIRCHKCGYSNQLNAKLCVKCRSGLLKEEAAVPVSATPDLSSLNKKTVVISASEEAPWDQAAAIPVQRNRIAGGVQTVRRVIPDHRSCYLVALSADEEKELRKIDLQGESISLDRAVLDPGNTSISRNGHASIYQKDGSWYLENMTALKTTFIQVNQPLKLTDGDVVLLGDSLFKFKLG